MSLETLIEETGARAHISNEAICDLKNIAKMLLRYAAKRGCVDLVEPDYCWKIAVGFLGNWEWQCKRIREGKQSGTLKRKVTDSLWRP